MKIVINCRLLNKRHGGPRRFLINMLTSLSETDHVNDYVLIVDTKTSFIHNWPKNFKMINLNTKSRILYEYITLPRYVNSINADIFIVPDGTFSPLIKAKKITIYHDIIYFEKNQKREFKFFDNLHHKIMIPICGKRTNLIICVSRFTEERVHALLGFKNTKVIYEDVEDSFKSTSVSEQEKILDKYNIKKPFLFYIGSMSPRKNIERIISSFDLIQYKISHNLYFLGGYSWKDKHIMKIILSPKFKERVKKIGYISENDLSAIYSAAEALVYPSLYEGFGLPIIEAQKCECPVITSNIGATREIAGDGAILVDPFNTKSISDGILCLIENKDVRSELIQKGRKNLARFSWDNSVKKLVDMYYKI